MTLLVYSRKLSPVGPNGFAHSLVSLLRSVKGPDLNGANSTAPSVTFTRYASISAHRVLVGRILRILGMRRKSQVIYPIVTFDQVFMINLLRRPCSMKKVPSQSMGVIATAGHSYNVIPIVFCITSLFTKSNTTPARVPPEVSGLGIVPKYQTQFVNRHRRRPRFVNVWHHAFPDAPIERRRPVRSEVGCSVANLDRHNASNMKARAWLA